MPRSLSETVAAAVQINATVAALFNELAPLRSADWRWPIQTLSRNPDAVARGGRGFEQFAMLVVTHRDLLVLPTLLRFSWYTPVLAGLAIIVSSS